MAAVELVEAAAALDVEPNGSDEKGSCPLNGSTGEERGGGGKEGE